MDNDTARNKLLDCSPPRRSARPCGAGGHCCTCAHITVAQPLHNNYYRYTTVTDQYRLPFLVITREQHGGDMLVASERGERRWLVTHATHTRPPGRAKPSSSCVEELWQWQTCCTQTWTGSARAHEERSSHQPAVYPAFVDPVRKTAVYWPTVIISSERSPGFFTADDRPKGLRRPWL